MTPLKVFSTGLNVPLSAPQGYHITPTELRQADIIIIRDTLNQTATRTLNQLTHEQAKRTIISTPLTHPAYHSMLTGLFIPAIVNDDPEQIKLAIQAVHQGWTSNTRADDLTRQQSRVLLGILNSHTTASLAAELHISEKTVNAHISSILQTYGIIDRAHLIAQIYQSGN